MKLYHFTHLLALPEILSEGITRGEVPTSPTVPLSERPNAANLTTCRHPERTIWGVGITDKMAIRLTVQVPQSHLGTFQEVAERYGTPQEHIETLGSKKDRQTWFYAFDGVPPEQICKIERLVGGEYIEQSAKDVRTLISAIKTERSQKLSFKLETTGPRAGIIRVTLKPDYSRCWLFDGATVP